MKLTEQQKERYIEACKSAICRCLIPNVTKITLNLNNVKRPTLKVFTRGADDKDEFHCSNGWIIVKATRYIDYIESIQLEIHNKETGYMTTLNWNDTNESSKSIINLIAKSICDNTIYPIRYYT